MAGEYADRDDEVRARIDAEAAAAPRARVARILRDQELARQLRAIDWLGCRWDDHAAACEAILADWRRTFRRRRRGGGGGPPRFVTPTHMPESRRFARSRGVVFRRRHDPFRLETGVG
jgi:hypothetical protein